MSGYQLNLWDTRELQELESSLAMPPQFAVQIPVEPSSSPCLHSYLGACWVRPGSENLSSFFGFAEFITALTLIAVVFTISDIRYRFRIATAPLPLIPISFWLAVAIGILTLVSDVWFSKRWVLPDFLASQALWHGGLGLIFLSLVLVWIFFAFVRPAQFGRTNAKRYVVELYRQILRGDDAELPTIASELSLSVRRIVEFCRDAPPWEEDKQPHEKRRSNAERYANDLLLLIGNRRFCRHVVARSPGTAIQLFQAASASKKYHLPLGQFARNISAEAIRNLDSIIYHEDEGYKSGLIGYIKPFSAAVYGDYQLVEGLARRFGAPLDVDFDARADWTAAQVEAYSKAVLRTLENYLAIGAWHQHSYSLARAFHTIEHSFVDAYKLNDPSVPSYPSDIADRLRVAVDFVRRVVRVIEKPGDPPRPINLRQRQNSHTDLYDQIARLMFQLVLAASHVKADRDRSWSIQHNMVWSQLFPSLNPSGKALRIVQFKLRRIIYDEVTRSSHLNYQSSAVLGLSLSVLGFERRSGQARAERVLQTALLAWTKKNLHKCWIENSEVVGSGLPANLSYDAEQGRLVKSYARGLRRETPKTFFQVDHTGEVATTTPPPSPT